VLTSVGIPTDFNAIPIDFVKQGHLLSPLREQKESLDRVSARNLDASPWPQTWQQLNR